jgi:hypothetical protein
VVKQLLILAVILVASCGASEEDKSRIITVKCEGLSHYTGLIGTKDQFTDSKFIKDVQYVFDLGKKEVAIDLGNFKGPFCSSEKYCDVNFGERLFTVVRGEVQEGRIWSTALSFDRETKKLRLTSSKRGSLQQNDFVCTDVRED